MTRTFKFGVIAAAAFIAAPAFAAPTMDANLELDTKSENQGRGLSQGGRVEFNIAGKAGNDAGFVAGRASVLATKSGGAGIDDMWGQIGTAAADVKFGKFEAADLFPLGKDVYVADAFATQFGDADGYESVSYRANALRGRFGNSAAHLALNVNAVPGVGFELGFVGTKAEGEAKGVRPVVTVTAGPATIKLGFESAKQNATATAAERKWSGFGITAGGNFGGAGVNVSLATTKIKQTAEADVKKTSFGLNATFGEAGVGYLNDKLSADGGSIKQNTFYVAYSLPLFATGAKITPALSTSKAKFSGSASVLGEAKTATGVAVRVNYAF